MDHYLSNIGRKFQDPQTSEMGYRTDFENLLAEVFPKEEKYHIQHDARAIGGNKPDFIVLKNGVPLLYIEAKDIGVSLDKIEKSDQMDRYFGYDNLILTDYVEFRFYRNGIKYSEPISIATFDKMTRTITSLPENFSSLSKTLVDFISSHKEPIKSGNHLARIMGGKAQRIRDNVLDMLSSQNNAHEDVLKIQKVVKENLVSSLDDTMFADMYAQTLVYGLFAARYNDLTADTFSRIEARELISKTNPFLRDFFDHIAGASFPERLRFIVDELCEVFTHADVEKILYDFYGKEKDNKDPIIHFYEDFLREYDAKKKMDMGVFYTPRPVVQFIIRAVDSILKTEFGLAKGLADTSKVEVEHVETNIKGKKVKSKRDYHRVQVLDIATGTGTFLNEVIQYVRAGFVGQEGQWPAYAQRDLLPRLHGFELMIASYTIAHLKLGMTLHDTGVTQVDRLGVYLTNTLEKPVESSAQMALFGIMDSIAQESKSASRIKSQYPIMCVIGNPPYSGESMNPDYTDNDVYKVEPGGKQKLKERNSKWINDDYVKFIRFAESLIEKNGEGVVGMITAHGYIDNPTFRGMRWHLRNTFDKIYVLDLHGNSNKKETSPDGSKDENVFDIKTGVSIILGVKKQDEARGKQLAQIYQADFYGTRKSKFEKLDTESIETLEWNELPESVEVWRIEGQGKGEYQKGFSVTELFPVNTVGIVTGRDAIVIADDQESLEVKVTTYASDPSFEYDPCKVAELCYKPFDQRLVYYDRKFIERGRWDIMSHFINKDNIGLIFARTQKNPSFDAIFLSKNMTEVKCGEASTGSMVAPLYLYSNLVGNNVSMRSPNLHKDVIAKIEKAVGDTIPENILDYVYVVLHSPSYREKYKEFLKSDFPRVPYPENRDQFWKLVSLGTKLRELHLMTAPECEHLITTYPEAGSNVVEKIKYENGNVYINDTQYFGNVPEIAWHFYIGGYQPAQKWLKDRKGRQLSHQDIEHYQKIIVVLKETDKAMKGIDEFFVGKK